MADTDMEQQPRIRDFDRLSMWTPTPGADGKRARLTYGMRDGSPRITVFTNDPNDTTGKGVISAPMNLETFFIFLDLFHKTIQAQEEVKYKIECFGSKWENGQRSNEKQLQSELCFGKDAQGMVWISVVAPNRPKIKFTFRLSDWHGIYDSRGSQITEAMASSLQAAATWKILSNFYANLASKDLELPRRQQGAGGASGGFTGKSTSTTTADFGEDINF